MRTAPAFLATLSLILAACAPQPAPGDDGASASAASTASSVARETVSDGTITIAYGEPFRLAVTPEQVTTVSYIPPCNPGFSYCLFLDGAYGGTNFEAAGLGIRKRPDIAGTRAECLSAQPDGYAGLTPVIQEEGAYVTGLFPAVGDAALGHYAVDELYRMSPPDGCYEILLRVAASRYENYESGSIVRFTDRDEAEVLGRLRALLDGITFADGGEIVWPTAR